MKKFLIIAGLTVALLVGAVWWSKSLQSNDPDTISRTGIHWHPELAIYVKGEKQEIPVNLGIGAVHNPMHTHDSSGIIHLEFQGVVRKDDLKLDSFFGLWGKDFIEFGSSVQMTVNGAENVEFQNYVMKDGDKIELRYE